MAQRGGPQGREGLAPGGIPLWVTDGVKEALSALLSPGGTWGQPARRLATGPGPKPRWLPLPELLSAPGINTTRRQRRVRVSHRVVVGTFEALQQGLAAWGWPLKTAGVARLNLTIRPPGAAIGRRVSALGQGAEGLAQPLAVSHGDDNVGLPHGRVRQPLPPPVPPTGTGSAKPWRPGTPAMAAGVTAHGWTLQAVRLDRGPPGPQPQTGEKPARGDDRMLEGLRLLRGRARGMDGGLHTGFECCAPAA